MRVGVQGIRFLCFFYAVLLPFKTRDKIEKNESKNQRMKYLNCNRDSSY